MQRINILIVEDQESHIKQWVNALDDFNMDARRQHGTNLEFSCQFAKSYAEAKNCLTSFNFSAAIIDIRLAEDDGQPNEDNTKGNDVLIDIVRSTMCLAWVYTGQQTDAEIPEHLVDYIELIDRAEKGKSDVLEDLSAKQDMLKSISEIKDQFSQSKAEHFYSAIWPRWSLWSAENSEYKDKAIIRHMATHLHASFLNETKNVHPEEYYFTGPMIEGALDTGDITMVDGNHYILVTPRCEIAQDKNSYYQFVELEDKSAELKQENIKLAQLRSEAKQKQEAVANSKKSIRTLEQTLRANVKAKNIIKTRINQSIMKKKGAKNDELLKLNLAIGNDVETLFIRETEMETAQKALTEEQSVLTIADKDLVKSNKAVQAQLSKKNRLLPNSGGKVSLHILPEIKQPNSVTYGPLHANFEKLIYVEKSVQGTIRSYEEGKYARLSNEFVPSFVERLGSHFSRIGTPDYSHQE